MTDRTQHFDDDAEFKVSHRLEANLEELFKPPAGVPPEVDRAVLDRAYKHFRQIPAASGRRTSHWTWLWRAAAAAAVIILAFSLNLTERTERPGERSGRATAQAVDIDQNGRVDILDAFKLARQIESARPTEQDWDIDGDGLVDVDDVDMVAFAAVRLDKGVL
jgi:hypothetical protein